MRLGGNEMTSDDLFTQANANFVLVHGTGKFKYKFLPNWVFRKSVYLSNEISHAHPNRKVYSQGAIVKVDFGVNVGSELSGHHFAVVLNKKDNRNNSKVTVVPLSSKDYKTSIELNEFISEKSNTELLKSVVKYANISISFLHVMQKLQEAIGVDTKVTKKTIRDIEDEYGDAITVSDYEQATLFLKKEYSDWNEDLSTILDKSKLAKQDLMMMRECRSQYEKYRKTSYAKIADITTVSKNRLMKINKLDPIGKIRISKESMESINVAIENQFFV